MEGAYFKYLAAGEMDRSWGLYCTVAGYASNPPGAAYPMQRHPSEYHFNWEKGRVLREYQISYITRGEGIYETAQLRVPIRAGMVFMVFPGEWHRYRPMQSSGWDEYYIGFQGSAAAGICELPFFRNRNGIYTLGHNLRLLQCLQDILEQARQEKAGCQQRIAGQIGCMLGEIYASVVGRDFSGKAIGQIMEQAQFEMRECLDQRLDIAALAARLGIGYSYFRRMFRRYTGLPPAQYHLHLRLQKARDLLRAGSGVKEAAYALGFDSPFHLSKQFKKKFSLSPRDFREQAPKDQPAQP
jgi:AraC-like DNA-binding protein